jgi:hypothetical protein
MDNIQCPTSNVKCKSKQPNGIAAAVISASTILMIARCTLLDVSAIPITFGRSNLFNVGLLNLKFCIRDSGLTNRNFQTEISSTHFAYSLNKFSQEFPGTEKEYFARHNIFPRIIFSF